MAPSAPISLIGPPEIYQAPASSAATAPSGPLEISQTTSGVSDPFVDLLVEKFNDGVAVSESPRMGLTENSSPTFLTTGNPCLDFFLHVGRRTPPETLIQRLELAWEQDPLKALKLVCHLRGVRGMGKSDKEGGYTAALWLHENHPKTLARNVESLANFGYFKDLLEILYRLLEGPDARKLAKEAYEQWKELKEWKNERKRIKKMNKLHGRAYGSSRRSLGAKRSSYKLKKDKKSAPNLSREEKRILRAKRVVERFNSDPNFKCLHNSVSDYFARSLRSDMEMLNSGRPNKISLAAKWCPSLNSSYDNFTLLCETIARKVFPRDEYPEYEGVEEAHYAYRVRDRLRKQVLVPLRRALELPEVYMGANDWASLPYNRVASVALKTYKYLFLNHDPYRFLKYLYKDLYKGKEEAKIPAGAPLPHQIIAPLFKYSYKYMNWYLNDREVWKKDDPQAQEEKKVAMEVAELQWRRMVDDMTKIGKLNNCLAVCDVSGIMYGVEKKVSVALGVLVSELSDEPWNGKVITFCENPRLETVKGSSLIEKVAFVQGMEWRGMNTDFQKVFDLVLEVAVSGKLKPDQMIKRLLVFSDNEFDKASVNPWETDYQSIVRKFKEKGFGESVPEIVFWKLWGSRATPVLGNRPGVALISGFSKKLMKLFLEEGGIVTHVKVMEAAIARKEYQNLVVID